MTNIEKSFVIAATMIFLSFTPGCRKADHNPAGFNRQNELIPLQLGNSWSYEAKAYQGDSLIADSNYTATLDTSFVCEGKEWFGLKGSRSFSSNAADGLWGLQLKAQGERLAYLCYPYPAQIGDSTRATGLMGNCEDTLSVTVYAVDDTLTVPAGKFYGCYVYTENYIIPEENLAPIRTWIKPGVGKLQTSPVEGSNNRIRTVVKLSSYHIVE